MVGHTTKVKIAAGIAAAGLALGAAGAYAANANNNGSIPVSNLKPVTLSGAGAGTLTLKSTTGKTTTLTIPATFPNLGQCVSLFAKHQDLVPTPAAGTTRLSKNSHGKLVSTIKAFCQPLDSRAEDGRDRFAIRRSARPRQQPRPWSRQARDRDGLSRFSKGAPRGSLFYLAARWLTNGAA
jgi:hypothetical protein